VEELSHKQISNPYLNQIEKGKIRQPSPNILYTLAEIYQASYEQLMELAGYFNPTSDASARHGKLATLSEMNLNEAEEQILAKYLQFLRDQQPR
jgi:transcriptional regulator with XRE-family HTH domain